MNPGTLVRYAVRAVPWRMRLIIKHIPGIAPLQRALISSTLDGETFVHEVDAGPARGVRFEVTLPDDKGVLTGTYEAAFASKVAAAAYPGCVCYDIGGWHGFFAGVFAAQGAREVHIFEPLPRNVRHIERMLQLNPGLPLKLHETAVGEGKGQTHLIVMPASSMAKLRGSAFQPDAANTETIDVQVRGLDEMIAANEIPPADIIKIDVEGAEVMVLRGAEALLRDRKPELFIEVHSSAMLLECQEILLRLGYSIRTIDDDPVSAFARDVFTLHAFDGLRAI